MQPERSDEHEHADHAAVFAPVGRDATVIAGRLAQAAIPHVVARDCAQLRAYLEGGIGTVLLAEEVLTTPVLQSVQEAIDAQPPWSDLPVLLLLAKRPSGASMSAPPLAKLLALHGVVVHRRPIPALTLVSAVRSALQARRRQHQVRDLLIRERRARERAEVATRVRDEFLALVSHEVRTPLTAITMWAQLLAEGRLDAAQRAQGVASILASAEAQSRLIEDLLDVARMITGKLRIRPVLQRLTPILRSTLEMVRPVADASGVRLKLEARADEDMVRVDMLRAQQILWNVISNAVKFTKRGGTVAIRVGREQDWVCVTVKDDGQGIAPELLPHIFERFRQEDTSGTSRHGGLGLGLTIVRQLVELHDGMIEAASEGRDKGAVIRIRLPAVRVAEERTYDRSESAVR